MGSANHRSVGYDPTARSVLFTDLDLVYRYDPRTGVTMQVGRVYDPSPYALERGASGRWYARLWNGIWIYDSAWREVDRVVGPHAGIGMVLLEGALLGNTFGDDDGRYGHAGKVYRVPVNDGPIRLIAMWGDPNSDQTITALDALICLSHAAYGQIAR